MIDNCGEAVCRASRVAAIAGVMFLVLFVAHRALQGAGPLQGAEATNPSTQAIVDYVSQHRRLLFAAEFVNGLGVLALVVFAGALTDTVRRLGAGVMAEVVLGSGLSFVGTALIATAGQTAMAAVAPVDGSAARASFALQAYAPVTLTIAGFVIATSVALHRTGVVRRWAGVAGVVAGLLILIGAAAQSQVITSHFLAPKGPAALLGAALFLIWTLSVCTALARLHPRTHRSVHSKPGS